MFCREQIAQLREYYPGIRKTGADLFVIGPGTAEQARKIAEQFEVEYTILADPQRQAFKAAGMRQDLVSNLNFKTLRHVWRTMRKGIRQGKVQGSPFQQGGALVIEQDGNVLFHFVGTAAGDHPNLPELLAVLKPESNGDSDGNLLEGEAPPRQRSE